MTLSNGINIVHENGFAIANLRFGEALRSNLMYR